MVQIYRWGYKAITPRYHCLYNFLYGFRNLWNIYSFIITYRCNVPNAYKFEKNMFYGVRNLRMFSNRMCLLITIMTYASEVDDKY